MNLAVLQENLKRGLATIAPAVPTKTTQQILTTVRLTATEAGRLELAATNLETTITCSVGAKVAEPGVTCVPAKLLADVIGSLPNDKITLTLLKTGLRLVCAGSETTIKALEADDFPTLPTVAPGAIQLTAETLVDVAHQVVLAAATTDARPALCGVRVVIDGAWATYTALDGCRLAQRTAELEAHVGDQLQLLVPAKALAIAAKALKDAEGPVQLGLTCSGSDDVLGEVRQLALSAEGVTVVTRLLDSTFPDTTRVIPSRFLARLVCDTGALRQAAQLAQHFAPKSFGNVKLEATSGGDLRPGRVTLSANLAEVGDAKVVVDAMADGPGGVVALNAAYLLDALGCIDTPQVAIELGDAAQPAVFKPVGVDGYLHIVMPMTVRSV